jgi:hypothetical protein
MEASMRSALLALLLSATAAAQTLSPCPDNGESSSTRRIRALQGKVVPVAQVPRELRERAEGFWRADFVSRGSDFPEPATGVHVKDARVYQFPHATFYLLRVNDVTTLVSAKCSWRCSSLWWDGEFTLLANADKPPAGVPGDEFYLRRPTLHAGQAVLVQADPFSDRYELTETCALRELTVEAATRLRGCTPTATTLCLQDRFELTASTIFQAHVTYAQVGLRSPESGTFWFFNRDAQDVLVRITDTCATDHHYTVRLAGVRTASVSIHDTITDKSVTHDVNGTARITTLPCTMMTKHR